MIKKITSFFSGLLIAGNLNATVQYTDYSPDQSVSLGASNNVIDLDIDGNSTYDLTFALNGANSSMYNIAITGNDVDIIVDSKNSFPSRSYATGLFAGASIGPSATWANYSLNRQLADDANQTLVGGERFIGFRFKANGQKYYGWVRLEITNSIDLKVKSFAVESEPNKVIIAGDTGSNIVSINEEKAPDFSFYPTTVKNQLHVNAANDIQSVEIFNLAGKKVYALNANSKELSLNLGQITAGIYIVRVRDHRGNSTSRKFIKRD